MITSFAPYLLGFVAVVTPSICVPQGYNAPLYGVDEIKEFTHFCVKSGPSFENALQAISEEEADTRIRRLVTRAHLGKLSIQAKDGACVCAYTFTTRRLHVDFEIDNLHTHLEYFFADQFVSGSKDPTNIVFDFDDVELRVNVGSALVAASNPLTALRDRRVYLQYQARHLGECSQ